MTYKEKIEALKQEGYEEDDLKKLTDEELESVVGGATSPYVKKKLLQELLSRFK